MADLGFLKNLGIAAGCALAGGCLAVVATREGKKGYEGAVDWVGDAIKGAIAAGQAHKEVATNTAEAIADTAKAVAGK